MCQKLNFEDITISKGAKQMYPLGQYTLVYFVNQDVCDQKPNSQFMVHNVIISELITSVILSEARLRNTTDKYLINYFWIETDIRLTISIARVTELYHHLSVLQTLVMIHHIATFSCHHKRNILTFCQKDETVTKNTNTYI